jgi:hypothetical protein
MALSLKPFIGTSATVVASGTAVEPSVPVPDNCHTIVCSNPGAAVVYLGWAPTSADFATSTPVVVPANGSVSLGIGPKSNRPATGSGGGVPDSLWVDASVNGTVVRLTYVNGMSS